MRYTRCLRALPVRYRIEPSLLDFFAATTWTDNFVLILSTGVSVFQKGRLQAWQKNSEWDINLALPHHNTILDPA